MQARTGYGQGGGGYTTPNRGAGGTGGGYSAGGGAYAAPVQASGYGAANGGQAYGGQTLNEHFDSSRMCLWNPVHAAGLVSEAGAQYGCGDEVSHIFVPVMCTDSCFVTRCNAAKGGFVWQNLGIRYFCCLAIITACLVHCCPIGDDFAFLCWHVVRQ